MKLPRLSDATGLAAILAVALALRVAWLGHADLSTDEIQTLHAVQLGWGDLVAERLRAGHVPLWFGIEKAWTSLAGTSQFALRLPSALFGVALLLPARSLFRRLAGDRTAWTGTALVAVHPLFVELSREARMYSALGLAALVVADRAAAALDGKRPGASFWTAVAAGPFIHPTWAVAMLPLAAWLAIERRGAPPEARGAAKRVLVGIAASLAVLAVALLFSSPQHQELTRRPWPREIGVFVLRMFAGSELGEFRTVVFAATFVYVWAIALYSGCQSADARERRLALWIGIGVPAASVLAGVLGGVPWGPARYIQFGVVGAVLLVAVSTRSHYPPAMAAAVLVFLFGLSIYHLRTEHRAWSDAAAALRDDPSPVVVDDEPSRIVLSHYLGRDVSVGTAPPGAASWSRARLETGDDGRREVRIDAERPPR